MTTTSVGVGSNVLFIESVEKVVAMLLWEAKLNSEALRRGRAFLMFAIAAVALVALSNGFLAYASDGSDQADLVSATEEAKDEKSEEPTPSETPTETETATPTTDHDCGKAGEYQKDLETTLASLADYGTIFADGKQSKEDCAAIKKFQKRMGIQPAEGYAGKLTLDVAQRIAKSSFDKCQEAKKGKTVCVDLTHQTLWVVEDGKRIFEPTVVRTGMAGYATQPGAWKIFVKEGTHWSKKYKVWLPYWQNFNNGEGLHTTTTYIHEPWIGSHGCVNLLPSDSKKLYEMLDFGDTVQVFGNRPGT
ncbi:L,D-transpeptidase family protein [Stackebrandtia nassauensis]|uniref:ErfK/YbiS/YcfS/YnhG family protein n=2 Tax=Stackebrandtia nassauensis (strain DSM 44728 / CIP 108903 / NRRL B-16338 / NBRC 102104 / LLR-40K-21) TaxID=446470 RepID=D3Q1D9_STANL|nr:L,D-transpeptidase [Stackebrandtia nassauensis]ADD45719.1 ErfK/YbiS/YcfS/YnhG family protein [Stackebrandtia nassauensis DSM 44728]